MRTKPNPVAVLWHGGSSYCVPSNEDAEKYPSIAAAVREFESRADNLDGRTPCVNRVTPDQGGPTSLVYYVEAGDYPELQITFGPRGGVRISPC